MCCVVQSDVTGPHWKTRQWSGYPKQKISVVSCRKVNQKVNTPTHPHTHTHDNIISVHAQIQKCVWVMFKFKELSSPKSQMDCLQNLCCWCYVISFWNGLIMCECIAIYIEKNMITDLNFSIIVSELFAYSLFDSQLGYFP